MNDGAAASAEEKVSAIHPPTVITAGSVVVHATTVTIGKEEPPPDDGLRRRYARNAAFLVVLTILLTIWFQFHLQTWATQGLIFGTATVWALWQLVLSSAKKDFAKDGEQIRKRLLGSEDAGSLLFLGCAAAVALLWMTTSVYVKLDDRDTTRLRVDLIDKATGKPFTDSIIVTPSSRVGGRLLFPRGKTSSVDVVVVEPAGYEYASNPIVLRPWTGVDVTFGDPAQFRKKKWHAVRIIPGWTMNGMDAPGHGLYDLTVKIGKDQYTLNDVSFRTVYLGVADEPSLKKIVERQSNAAFGIELQDHLNSSPGWDPDDEKVYLTDWQKAPRTLITRDVSQGEAVIAGIGVRGGKFTWSKPATITDAEVTTIFVEKPQ
jgi:hypothetical protein